MAGASSTAGSSSSSGAGPSSASSAAVASPLTQSDSPSTSVDAQSSTATTSRPSRATSSASSVPALRGQSGGETAQYNLTTSDEHAAPDEGSGYMFVTPPRCEASAQSTEGDSARVGSTCPTPTDPTDPASAPASPVRTPSMPVPPSDDPTSTCPSPIDTARPSPTTHAQPGPSAAASSLAIGGALGQGPSPAQNDAIARQLDQATGGLGLGAAIMATAGTGGGGFDVAPSGVPTVEPTRVGSSTPVYHGLRDMRPLDLESPGATRSTSGRSSDAR